MAFTLPNLLSRVTDLNGHVVSEARLYVYAAGTLTPANVYSDSALTVPHAHPVVADIGGLLPRIYMADGNYKLLYTDATDVPVLPAIDNYEVASGGSGSTSLNLPSSTKTANYTVLSSDRSTIILCDASGAVGQNILISANSATLTNGFPVWIINKGAAGTVTIQGSGAQTINGTASLTLTTQNGGIGMASEGAGGWRVFTSEGVFVNDIQFLAGIKVAGTATFDSIIATVSGPLVIDQCRGTLITNTPVMTTDVGTTAGTGGATRIYDTPYNGGCTSIFNGTSWEFLYSGEIFFDLSDTANQPSATAASSAYDVFKWKDNAGVIRLIHGPAWTNLNTRSAGAAITKIGGVDVNAVAITNGPAVGRGTWVGSFMTSAANTVLFVMNPAPAVGGGNCVLGLWNRYNRVLTTAKSIDSAAGYGLGSGTVRPVNNSTNNRITIFNGLHDSSFCATSTHRVDMTGNASVPTSGIGYDSTTAYNDFVGRVAVGSATSYLAMLQGKTDVVLGVGSHFFQWLESGGSGSPTFSPSNGLLNATGMM